MLDSYYYKSEKQLFVMVLQEESWGNLVFVSVLGKWHNKAQISNKWNISVSGGPLYQENTNKEIQELVENDLIEKRGSTLYADIESNKFSELLKDHLEKKRNKSGVSDVETRLYSGILDNYNDFMDFITTKEIRKEIFKIENITNVYTNYAEAKKAPFKIFDALLSSITVYFSKKVVKNQIKDKGLQKIFEGMFETMYSSSKGNVRPLVKSISKLHNKSPRKFDFIKKELREIIKDKIGDQFSQIGI